MLSMGWDVELATRPDGAYKKRKPANVENVALGALTDLKDAPKGFGTAEPDPARLERIRALLREYWSGRKITPSQAESLVGKAKHATQQLCSKHLHDDNVIWRRARLPASLSFLHPSLPCERPARPSHLA